MKLIQQEREVQRNSIKRSMSVIRIKDMMMSQGLKITLKKMN